MSLPATALVLFLIMNPVGNIAGFSSVIEELKPKRQRLIIIREMIIALALIIGFNFLGEMIFQAFSISETTVHISSGVIMFLVALKILFPGEQHRHPRPPKGEPFLVPLAIPMLAGPALLATVMLFAHTESKIWLMLTAIGIAWAATFAILMNALFLNNLFGKNFLTAGEKLVGLLLVLLGIQRFLEGIKLFMISLS